MPGSAEKSKSKEKFLKFFNGLKKKKGTPQKAAHADVSQVNTVTEPIRRENPTQAPASLKPLSIPDPPSAPTTSARSPPPPPPASFKKKVITYGVKYWRWSIPLLSKAYIIYR